MMKVSFNSTPSFLTTKCNPQLSSTKLGFAGERKIYKSDRQRIEEETERRRAEREWRDQQTDEHLRKGGTTVLGSDGEWHIVHDDD
ncbi:MAG: hypothetical protein A2Y25_01355 [Candidatus Melainabacteria bacterium GWF2_37_15]|nr:MAG: hypothetical protein A2Y25_01355 [Candidatus Melainabacteria bacterium GWF2_37_15]